MKTQALVASGAGAPLSFEEIELSQLRPNECLVQMVATGICHTDLKAQDGSSIVKYPVVLGHEGLSTDLVELSVGAGVVKEVGKDVKRCQVGDKVLLSFNSCGECKLCEECVPAYCKHCLALNFGGTRLDGSYIATWKGKPLHANFFGQSSMSRVSIVSERSIVKVSPTAPLETLAPLGCGLQTGAGSVLNVLKVPKDSSIAVIGVGAVGLAALMASKIASAKTIIAVDIHQSRLELAVSLGATHTILSKNVNLTEAIREIVPEGVNFAVDCTGVPVLIEQMISALAARGKGVTIGSPGQGQKASINIFDHLVNGRSYVGTHQGDSNPEQFIPFLIGEFEGGRFPFDRFVTHYKVQDFQKASEDVHSGKVIKAVLLWD